MSKLKKPLVEKDDFNEEQFFNNDSHNNFIEKNNIHALDDKIYINNNQHKIDIVVPDEYRITSEIMTLAEYTRVISERAKQIEDNAPIFIDIENETNPIKIAEKEIKQKKSPMKIRRYLTANILEIWKVNCMVIPFK